MDTIHLLRKPLTGLQIALLAFATSTFAALAVLLTIRGLTQDGASSTSKDSGSRRADDLVVQPAIDAETSSRLEGHFSEDVVIPGFTETGVDTEEENERGQATRGGV